MSVDPPAANPTHIWIGLVGYLASADQHGAVSASISAIKATTTEIAGFAFITSPFV
jgi:hypothetical protein